MPRNSGLDAPVLGQIVVAFISPSWCTGSWPHTGILHANIDHAQYTRSQGQVASKACRSAHPGLSASARSRAVPQMHRVGAAGATTRSCAAGALQRAATASVRLKARIYPYLLRPCPQPAPTAALTADSVHRSGCCTSAAPALVPGTSLGARARSHAPRHLTGRGSTCGQQEAEFPTFNSRIDLLAS